jgi:hypothetical protein
MLTTEAAMTLSFPNPARSYDESKRRVRFLGHDGMFEVRFFVAAEVLSSNLVERTAVSDDYLASFDSLRPKILKAAQAAYKAKNAQSIMLDLENFK